MGKNQRHKKKLKSEKSKTQLKASAIKKSKTLPKGTNVTDTNFKIKPIVLIEQLRAKTGEEPLSKRKLNLKELLSRLNHYNANVKCEACQGLSELITPSHFEVIEQNLYALLQGVGKLVLDEEQRVRQKAIKLISDVLESVNNMKLAPFLNVLAAYATCAMTAINKNVQEDSLLLIDAFLKHTPELFVRNLTKMLTNFLTLISTLKSDSKLSRTLTLNLKRGTTSIKWRTKVLSRISGILKIVIEEKYGEHGRGNDVKVVRVDETMEIINYVPLRSAVRNFDLTLTDLCDVITTQDESRENRDNARYVCVLLPLLYETWAEAVPIDAVKYVENGATVIDRDSATILGYVTEILHLLWEFVGDSDQNRMKRLFLSKENSKLFDHLLAQFPYVQRDVRKSKTGRNDASLFAASNDDPKCVKPNLEICYVFSILYESFSNPRQAAKAQEVLNYLNVCLINRNYVVGLDCVRMLTRVLRTILFDDYKTWFEKGGVQLGNTFDNVVRFYDNLNHSRKNEEKLEVLELLCDLVSVQRQTIESKKYDEWISTLPLLLCAPEVPGNVLDMFLSLLKRNNASFQRAILNHLPQIFKHLPTIKFRGEESSHSAHVKVISMFFYLPSLREDNLVHFKKFVDKNKDTKMATYLLQILNERMKKIRADHTRMQL